MRRERERCDEKKVMRSEAGNVVMCGILMSRDVFYFTGRPRS